jgi:catechol 2,3-dioxygenase
VRLVIRLIAQVYRHPVARAPTGGYSRCVLNQAVTTRIAPATRMGAVRLTVADLERSARFYRAAIGLTAQEEADGRLAVGAGAAPLLELVELPGARPAPTSTGLFHFALRVPQRVDLARWLAHAARERIGLTGLSDHFVSEAIYLRDPDHHGIEIYHDRAREVWEGQVGERLTTDPLDVDALLGELPDGDHGFDGLPAGTDMGHVHLQVAAIPDTIAFYRDVLGFDLMAAIPSQAAFLAAGGYHHHLGANVWNSRGAAPPPDGSAALVHATIVLPDREERDRVASRAAAAGRPGEQRADGLVVHDPSGNGLLLTGP